MKTNKLMTKLSLVLLLSGFFGVGMKANTVHADDWGLDVGYGLNKGLNDSSDQTNKQHSVHDSDFDPPYGFHLSGPISDVPLFTPSEIKAQNAHYNYKKLSRTEERKAGKLDSYKHPVKVRGYKMTKLVRDYYNSCSTKFSQFNKLRSRFDEQDIDLVHHNNFFLCANLTPNGKIINGDYEINPKDPTNSNEYVLGYKKINGFWTELTAYKFYHENIFAHPEFAIIGQMPSNAVYKCIKDTNMYDYADDGTANGFGDKDHQYAQVTYNIDKGTKLHINDDTSNWRANYNVQKVYGKDMIDSTASRISMINFNKYFKRIK